MKNPSFCYYIHDGPAAFSIELAGALAAEGPKRLEREWRSAFGAINEKKLIVDLSFVTEIDSEGRRLLLRWLRNGATIVANTPESRALAESIAGRPLFPSGRISYTSCPHRARWSFGDVLRAIGLLALISAAASAQSLSIVRPINNESVAFARYIAWLHARDPFTESGPVAVAIAASLPGLDKQGSLLAIRDVDESERSQYGILRLEGDSIVFQRVIAPYFAAKRQTEDRPLSSVLITPQNYSFRYAGAVGAGDTAAYIFRITPKKNRVGMIRGELWIEPLTGAPILVTGHVVKTPFSFVRGADVASEITFVGGYPCARTTHMMIETRPLGRAELTIIEFPLHSPDPESTLPSIVAGNRQ